MNCPVDKIEMNPVITVSHYGQPIYLDQCERCGGIWFDESELFSTRQGEAEKIEALDIDALKSPSIIEEAQLTCPRDKMVLRRFTDKYFPKDIILECCPLCKGIWLNRGLFTKYQGFRQERTPTKEKSPEDKKLEERVSNLIAEYQSGSSTETLKRLGEFLNAPVDSDISQLPPPAEKVARNVTLDLIMTVLGAFLPFRIPFKFK